MEGTQLNMPAQSPSSSSEYQYEQLRGAEQIRLLRTQRRKGPQQETAHVPLIEEWDYEIVTFDAADTPAYNTVSYVWGDSARPWVLQLQDGSWIGITTSIRDALPYLSARCSTGYLWIDQLSINQDDVQERNEQVRRMGEIYSNAQQLIIWLGLEDEVTEKLAEMGACKLGGNVLEVFENPEVSTLGAMLDSLMSTDDRNSRMLALRHLFASSWFTRAWVFQEYILSCRRLAIKGRYLTDINLVAGMWQRILQSPERSDYLYGKYSKEHGVPRSLVNLMAMTDTAWSRHSNKNVDFCQLLSAAVPEFEVSDPRDLLYGFLGMRSLDQHRANSVNPDYRLSPEEAFIAVTEAIIQSDEGLDVFAWLRPQPLRHSRIGSIPSWCPDWSVWRPGVPIAANKYDGAFFASRGRHHRVNPLPGPKVELIVHGRAIGVVGSRTTYIDYVPLSRYGRNSLKALQDRLSLDLILEHFNSVQFRSLSVPIPEKERVVRALLIDGSDNITLSGDELEIGSSIIRYSEADIHFVVDLCDRLNDTSDWLSRVEDDEELKRHDEKLWFQVRTLADLSYRTSLRHVLMMESGRLGTAPLGIEVGDHIIIAHGSTVPLAVHPIGGGRYTLRGQRYIEDVMYGEACTWAEEEAEEFVFV